MSYVYLRNPHPPHRRRLTRIQRAAKALHGRALPIQPRRPLRLLAGHPVYGGRVSLVTNATLAACPELRFAYIQWLTANLDRLVWEGGLRLGPIADALAAARLCAARMARAARRAMFESAVGVKHASPQAVVDPNGAKRASPLRPPGLWPLDFGLPAPG